MKMNFNLLLPSPYLALLIWFFFPIWFWGAQGNFGKGLIMCSRPAFMSGYVDFLS